MKAKIAQKKVLDEWDIYYKEIAMELDIGDELNDREYAFMEQCYGEE